MIPITVLGNGKPVYLDGDSISQQEALEIAGKLLATWGDVYPKIKAMLLYEWKPQVWNDCPHEETLETALESVKNDESV